jgi:hypothetical membrane protein
MKALSNVPPPKDTKALWKNFADTYFSLRTGLVVLAFSMPVVLYGYGKLRHGLDLQPSMSRYFWAAMADQCAAFPMRSVFVGFLFAIGVGLYLYKGLTRLENALLNLAAVCAALVAIYPERLSVADAAADQGLADLFQSCPAVKAWADVPAMPIHYVAAVALFVLLATVAWICADKSLEYLPPDQDAAKFRRTYKAIAIAMIAFPLLGLVVAFLFGFASSRIFFIEAAGIWTFGVFWAVKSRELSLSRLQADPEIAIGHAMSRQAMAGNAPTTGAPGAAS